MLGGEGSSAEQWKDLVLEADEDGDGQINFEEFKNMMKRFSSKR